MGKEHGCKIKIRKGGKLESLTTSDGSSITGIAKDSISIIKPLNLIGSNISIIRLELIIEDENIEIVD